MHATADEQDFTPPPPRWDARAWLLALGAHALLIAALAWGIGWQHDVPVVASAELWASVPKVAAPRAAEPPPDPPAPIPPTSPRLAPPPPAATQARPADIAVQRQREEQRRREEEARRLAQERAERQKAEQERQARLQAERERQAREHAAREQAAREKAAREAQQRERELQAQLEAERRRNLERILGQAAASGGTQARGADAHDAGPSASYAGRVVAAIRPNIIFTDSVPGNPRAEVEVRTLPDGTILSSRLLRSSGHRAWDDAVLRAIERTGRLPRDENGRVPSTLILGFRPQE
ncbi:IgA-specific serine endopeptidase autotransporter [Tepidimonas alkaliphilus]|uniref:IgA-specific serine endopeptidase autotransporter n=1 Tax=Tepidimonas alkaliphilus TaxID=2588942 RepID=A0A554W4N8_9BURK|nr:cell envelope integrity protein TolA [Tepidimonas alkaliphilus]TSE18540.1 IgA-specific serine endopeptidase autotransporter [Tepidimonas alkaliphilus]